MTGGSALGRISPNMMRRLPMPMERQAWTNSRSRSDMNSARVNLAIGVQVTIPTAMVTYSIFCPRDRDDGQHENQDRNRLKQFRQPHQQLIDPASGISRD